MKDIIWTPAHDALRDALIAADWADQEVAAIRVALVEALETSEALLIAHEEAHGNVLTTEQALERADRIDSCEIVEEMQWWLESALEVESC